MVLPRLERVPVFQQAPGELDALWAGSASYREISLGKLKGADRGPVQDEFLTAHLFDDTVAPKNDTRVHKVGRLREEGTWGPDVRHMIAPFLKLDTLVVDGQIGPADTSFDALTVLILTPRAARLPITDVEEACRTHEYGIAVNMFLSRLPRLRVVVVGASTFWYQMPEDRTSTRGWFIRRLEDAIADPAQWAVMKRELHPADWRFFSPVHGNGIEKVGRWIVVRRVEEGDAWRGVPLRERLNARVAARRAEEIRQAAALGYGGPCGGALARVKGRGKGTSSWALVWAILAWRSRTDGIGAYIRHRGDTEEETVMVGAIARKGPMEKCCERQDHQ
ncbi:hypothetical protein MMC34_002580 [Xylographa carneopallida]|nr:hypothetical protein [Xylographa carneopallida]